MAVSRFQVDRQIPLAAVLGGEHDRALAQPVTGIGPLYLDDIRAETGQQAGGIRPGYLFRQVDDLDARQHLIRCHRDPPLPIQFPRMYDNYYSSYHRTSCREREGRAEVTHGD